MRSWAFLPTLLIGTATVTAPLSVPAQTASGARVPVSPTGIPYTVPAAARGAGWTIAASEARTGFIGSNPAFVVGGARAEIAVDAAWAQRNDVPALNELDSRLSSLTGKMSLGNLAAAVSYQRPFHAEFDGAAPNQQELRVLLGAVGLELAPALRVGASLAAHELDSAGQKERTFQASAGVELGVANLLLAGAVKSPIFGADEKRLNEPAWLQADARLGLGPIASLAVRAGVGWWNDNAADALKVPVDVGIGATWQLMPALRVLAGAHHISDRAVDVIPSGGLSSIDPHQLRLDQGTFLDAGVSIGLAPVHVALAVEDNRVFNPDVPATWVTLSAGANF
jgi:hypothetical protein